MPGIGAACQSPRQHLPHSRPTLWAGASALDTMAGKLNGAVDCSREADSEAKRHLAQAVCRQGQHHGSKRRVASPGADIPSIPFDGGVHLQAQKQRLSSALKVSSHGHGPAGPAVQDRGISGTGRHTGVFQLREVFKTQVFEVRPLLCNMPDCASS